MSNASDQKPRQQTAALTVLNITELLETILMFTSKIDIFVAHRVCKKFNDTIQGSSVLQRKLYSAEQESTGENTNPLASHVLHSHVNQFLLIVQPHIPNLRHLGWHYADFSTPTVPLAVPVEAFEISQDIWEPRPPLGWQGKTMVHTQGSWRNMAFGDRKIRLRLHLRSPTGRTEAEQLVAGVTFGDLFQAFEDLRKKLGVL